MTISVLHVAQPVDAGVARVVADAARDQLERGWDVTVACPDGGRLAADLATAGVPRLAWNAVRSPGLSVPGEARRLRTIVDQIRPSVLHLHASKAGLAGRLTKAPMPVVFQPHGWSWLVGGPALQAASRTWERAAAHRTDLLICVGEAEAAEGRRHGVRGRYEVIRNGVDLDRFQPAGEADRLAARARLAVPPDEPLAVCVGRLTRQKGQDVLLAAWPAVRRRCPRAHLALVGDGDLLATLPAAPGVTYAGAVDDVRDWLTAADVVVLPSRWEGLSLAVLEAFAIGRGVVVSDIPGLSEAVAPKVGAKVPPGDLDALAGALAHRLSNPDVARAEGAAAARHARRFDQRQTYQSLAEATAGLIGRGTRERAHRHAA